MDFIGNTKNLKVEITSYCNAACPGCVRNDFGGGVVDTLELNHMNIELWQRLMREDTKDYQFKEVLFDGNVGDFCMHPDAIKFAEAVMEYHPETEVHINTNGGARNEKFWTDLGKTLSNINHRINFAIDGLEDTHHIHRRRTTYDVVKRNMLAFINAGGRANWVYTAFDHNIHQIAEAKQRSQEYGCGWFEVRQSCIPGEDMYTKTDKEEYEIGTTKIDDIDEYLEKFLDERYKIAIQDSETEHDCKAYRERQIQIDWKGNIWPCSYIYSTEVLTQQMSTSPFYMERIEHPKERINLNHYSLNDILQGLFYTEILPEQISCKSLEICNRNCF